MSGYKFQTHEGEPSKIQNLSVKQKAFITSLYKKYKETGKKEVFVTVKGISTTTMKSLYKTGLIESDRILMGVPANMRINDAGIAAMEKYYSTRKLIVDDLVNRNKQFIRFVQNTNEKREVLLNYLKTSPMIKSNIDVIHKGYGIFEVVNGNIDEQYYGVYTLEEGNQIEIGGCHCREYMNVKYYIECINILRLKLKKGKEKDNEG